MVSEAKEVIMRNSQKGVSLVTVLLFMLVATIAATATYKWLSSSNSSSASRMLQSEARQAALSGLESARSWMTYHGNETGAILNQFFSGNKKPIKLNSVLGAVNNGKQSYSVYLVGADVSSSTYRIKLVSIGESNSGSKHTESTILKLNGLYRVKIPTKKARAKYEYSYFGGTTNFAGNKTATAMVINGNWSGNPGNIERDFVVTGNASLSGNNISVGGVACLGGNANVDNGMNAGSVYIEDDATNFKSVTIEGDAYFDGSVAQSTGFVKIGGSMTANNHITTAQNAGGYDFTIDKNMCLGENGVIESHGTNASFIVGDNVWVPSHDAIYYGTANWYQVGGNWVSVSYRADNYSAYDKIILGNKSTSKVYVADGHPYADYATLKSGKTVTETSSFKKYCKSSMQTNCYPIAGCYGNSDGCYSWENWGGTTYSPYPSVNQKDNLYYFYYVPGEPEVSFKEYANGYWKHAEGYSWISPTNMGAYHVGGKLFFDTYSVWNYYNYEDGHILGSPYCKGTNDSYRPECHISSWFKSMGTVSSSVSGSPDFACADTVKSHCEAIWDTKDGIGCKGENHKVPDMLQTGYSAFSSFATEAKMPACAKGIDKISSANVTKMQECYNQIKSNTEDAKKYLYNGYLVLSLKPDENAASGVTTMELNGKFIFIYESQYNGNHIRFPSTTSSSSIFVYLREGATGHLQTGTGNYFIFTEKSLGGLIAGTWNGSIYASAKNCAEIPDINGNVTLKYNADVVSALSEAGVICEASAATCGGVGTVASSASTATTTTDEDGYDVSFIATGAQISTEMESQYKNSETVSDASSAEIAPSIIVLPRIIYLTKDAKGKLKDYFTVVPLNGARVAGSGTISDCTDGAPPTTGTMVVNGNLLNDDPGFYSCNYTESDGTKSYTSKFYISVSGVTAEAPKLRFVESSREEINVSMEPSKDVTLFVSGVESPATTTFSVQIDVSDAPSGWTISQMETSKMSCNGGTCTYTGTLSSSDQEVKLFTVTTDAGSKSGNVTFQLKNPTDATIISPAVRQLVIQGTSLIYRGSIGDYCSKSENSGNCSGENAEFAAAAALEDCPTTGGTWIYADGIGCMPDSPNNSWKCDAGNDEDHPITLMAGSYDPRYCTLYLPTVNNSIVNSQDYKTKTDGYYLYASLKKKSFSLHVETVGTDVGEVRVYTKSSPTEEFGTTYTTCKKNQDCNLSLTTNTNVKLEVVTNGDIFSRWLCSGGGCFEDHNSTIPVTFVVDGNSSYTFKFNEKDTHCFYSDFKNTSTKIWCEKNEIDCVEHCSGSAPCEVDQGAYSQASWNVINTNSDNNLKPDNSKGYVRSNGGTTPIMMMNTVEGGYDGKFSVRLRSGMNSAVGKYWNNLDFLNSGIVLRSTKDGKEHITVNIYGLNATGSDWTISASTHARVCYVNGGFKMESYNSDVCTDIKLTSKNAGLLFEWFAGTSLNFDFTLSGNTLSIRGSYSGTAGLYEAIGSVDLSTLVSGALADDTHSYVGLKLADATFGVYDAAWHSTKYGDECWGDPTVSCSFASKYLGGQVPLATEASPDVAFSSWFASTGAGCMTNVTYYYNGCDLADGYSSALGAWFHNTVYCGGGAGSEGYYQNYLGADGTALSSNIYKFTYEGKHGFKHSSGAGYVRNASVSVNCNSVNGRKYEASCGEFYVGEQVSCAKNVTIVRTSTAYSYTGGEITFGGDDGANMRESDVVFDLSLEQNQTMSARFVDKDGNSSNTIVISETGVSTVSINRFADQYGFNPEKVTKLVLTGSSSFTVNSIATSCPYALSVNCQSAVYTGTQWKVTAAASAESKAKKCLVTGDETSMGSFFGLCNSAGEYFVTDEDFYKNLNESNSDKTHTFTVKVFDDEDATETSDPAAWCEVKSGTYSPAKITRCALTGSTSIYQGAGLPEVQYSIENCSDYKCDYEILLMNAGTQVKTETNQTDFEDRAFSSNVINGPSEASYLSTGTYSYKVVLFKNIGGVKTVFDECPSSSFEVNESTPAYGTCTLNSSTGVLTIGLYGASFGSAVVSLIGTDVLGNLLNVESIAAGSSQTIDVDLTQKNLPAGTVLTLSVGGVQQTCGTYPPAASSSSTEETSQSSASVASSSSVDDNYTCGFERGGNTVTEVWEGADNVVFKLTAKNITRFQGKLTGSQASWVNNAKVDAPLEITDFWVEPNQSKTQNFTAPVTGTVEGKSYTFTVTNGSTTICSAVLKVKDAFTCSLTPKTVPPGGEFTMSGTFHGTDCREQYSWDKTNNKWPGATGCPNISHTFNAPMTEGKHVYMLGAKGSNPNEAQCYDTLTVQEAAPTCSVDDLEKGKSTNVSVKPASLLGCDASTCSYTITKKNSTVSLTSGNNYKRADGNLAPFTGESQESTDDGTEYTLTFTNSKGSGSCDFRVKYVAESCTEYDKTTTQSNLTVEGSFTGCVKIEMGKSFSNAQIYSNCNTADIEINGSNAQTRSDGYYSGSITSGNPLTARIPSGCTVSKFYLW